MRSFSRVLFPVILILAATSAFASGFALYEQGAKATAMGGAFTATADDPSAIFYNVAGIAQLRQTQFMAGGTVITFSNTFTGDPNDPFTSGTTGRYRDHVFVPPNAYVTIPFQNNLTFGIGIFTPFGLRTNWESPWVGRFISSDANVKTVSVEPAVAWRTDDGGINIGFGVEYRRSHIILAKNSAAYSPFANRFVDIANARLNSDWNNALGYNVGILLKSPDNAWRVGASYRSGMRINYSGDAEFTQIKTGTPLDPLIAAQLPPNQKLSTSIKYPAIENYAIATGAIPNWDIEADVVHTRWESFKTLDVEFSTTPSSNLHRPQDWHNSFSYRLGANRKLTPRWDMRLGALYDETPQPLEGVGPLLPDSDRIGASVGVGYHNGPWSVDITEFLLHFKTRSTNGTNLDQFNGTYKTDANLVSVDFGFRF